ncbi:MAG TPA: BTAD domain-containing putative transcriptional regulator [Micromonosporaceae bacterium]|nr:BTAD domain-containing putative transcriptional regulator [Micromonosporaceae bacterium]
MAPGADPLEFRVLGPFEASCAGRPLNLGGPQLRSLLARLLMDAGRPVSVPALVETLWADQAPADAERTVRTYVSRLRKAMQPGAGGPAMEDVLVTHAVGYELRIDPAALDAARFEQLVAAGRQALDERPQLAAQHLADALELWRGNAYGEFDGCPALAGEGVRLNRLRLSAVEDRVEAELATGRGGELVGELEALVRAHPARERLRGQLMIALYRSGRQAEALSAFREARAVLVGEYGVDPSPRLAEIHQQILTHDPRLLPAGDRIGAAPVPAQLPFVLADFAGRDGELARLDAIAAGAGKGAAIAVLSGTAGVGKTTLAVCWAHRAAARFPDGQLYVNLRGFDPRGSAVRPDEALCGFLSALGTPAELIPDGTDEMAARYRSALAGKRVLVVLDNARDVEQVRPLLPGSAGSMTIVASRSHLTGLVAAEGARPVVLDLLSTEEARALLSARLGAEKVSAEPDAVEEIIDRCARLPLALAIAAARAATHPRRSLARLAAELRSAAGALDAFEVGDPATNVRVAFSWSYRSLSPAAAQLFRMVGLHPGPDLTVPVAASLVATGYREARAGVDELVRASLLTEPAPDRFCCHDLLRTYAGELARSVDSGAERGAAIRRMLDHYLHTAYGADRMVHRHRTPITLVEPAAGSSPQRLPNEVPAWAWLTAEHGCLLAAQRLAADQGWQRVVWQLAWVLDTFHQRQGHPREHVATWQAGLAAAERVGHPSVQILARRRLGDAYARAGRHADAERHLHQALALADRVGDADNRADTHRVLARTLSRRGDHRGALDHATLALSLFKTLGHPVAQAAAASSVGHYSTALGLHGQARAYLDEALALARKHRARLVEAHTLHSLGYLAQQTGRHIEALALFHQSLELARDNSDTFNEATLHIHVGNSHAALGDHDEARRAWRTALRMCRHQHRTNEAERLRQQLDKALAHAV